MSSVKLFKRLLNHQLSFRRSINKNPDLILIPHVDESVLKGIEINKFKVYNQPGKSKYPFTCLDDEVQQSIQVIIGDSTHKLLVESADKLCKIFAHRQVPLSIDDLKDKSAICYWDVYNKLNVDLNNVSEKKYEKIEKKITEKAERLLKYRVHQWYPINYTRYVGKQYLVNRMAPEFAVLKKVFGEIRARCPDFKPHSLFDLGSGVGTVTLAARKFWEDSIEEYYNVDPSEDMLQLAKEVLSGGNSDGELRLKNVFHRQFMPSKADKKYSLVVCSYTLLDFSSSEDRLRNIMKLWNKTEDFLVLVEKGDAIGFRLILEARDFIQETDKFSKLSRGVHVFAPCPHDLPCPMTKPFDKTCRSSAAYERLPISRTRFTHKEHFCFLILRKGPRPPDDEQWPRVVCPSKINTKRTQCYLCTKKGKISHFLFRKSKHGVITNQICRATKIGERLPISFSECDLTDFKDVDDSIVEMREIENIDELPDDKDDDNAF